jgi:hypothetical protein
MRARHAGTARSATLRHCAAHASVAHARKGARQALVTSCARRATHASSETYTGPAEGARPATWRHSRMTSNALNPHESLETSHPRPARKQRLMLDLLQTRDQGYANVSETAPVADRLPPSVRPLGLSSAGKIA